MKQISFYTLGCRLNQSETAVVERTFETEDYKVVEFHDPADIAIINTCTVTQNGDADTRRLVNKAVRANPNVKIALIGCQAQVQKDKLTELPNVQWVVGNAEKMNVKSILESLKENDGPQVITPTIPRESFTIPVAAIDKHHTRANLKIQDGCDFFCSFCEIPYARGRARSREFNDIIKEANILAKEGNHKEVVITGINVGTYEFENHGLADVIDALENIEGLERIRISSIEPTTIADRLIKKMADPDSKLCRYLHIPLQSGHNDVLTNMKRKYSLEEFDAFIHNVKAKVPEVMIGTDVIVGFPGETKEQFEHTENYLREAPVDYFHVFSYSKRHLAKSQHMDEPIDIQEIQRRSKVLRDLSFRKRQIFYRSLLGSTQRVLFEQEKEGMWTGLTDHYVRVFAPSQKPLTNQISSVKFENESNLKITAKLI